MAESYVESNMSQRSKILVIDDELSIREMLQIFLKREGFEVTTADPRWRVKSKNQERRSDRSRLEP